MHLNYIVRQIWFKLSRIIENELKSQNSNSLNCDLEWVRVLCLKLWHESYSEKLAVFSSYWVNLAAAPRPPQNNPNRSFPSRLFKNPDSLRLWSEFEKKKEKNMETSWREK